MRLRFFPLFIILVFACFIRAVPALAADPSEAADASPTFGGPDAVERQLETDREEKGSLIVA
jgi:hypothetical protein